MSDFGIFRAGAGVGILLMMIMVNLPSPPPLASSLELGSGRIERCDFHSGGRYGQSFSKIVLEDQDRYFEVAGTQFRETCSRLDDERPKVVLAYHDTGRDRYAFSPLFSSITWPAVDVWSLRTSDEEILSYGGILMQRLVSKALIVLMAVAVLFGLGWLVHDRASTPDW